MDIIRRPSDKSREEIEIDFEKLSADWNLYSKKRGDCVREKPIRLVKPE